jgi:ankyrin repeat protein
VDAGADVGARTRTGSTPLHAAAWDNPHAVPLLLELGADPTASNDDGTTALNLIKRNTSLRGLSVVNPA